MGASSVLDKQKTNHSADVPVNNRSAGTLIKALQCVIFVLHRKVNAVCDVNVDEPCTFRRYNPICFITAVIPDDADYPSVKASHGMIDTHDECAFNRSVELLSPLDLAVVHR